MILFFDTETTGLPKNYRAPMNNLDNWPRVIQLGWQLYHDDGKLIEESAELVYPDGWAMPKGEFWKKHGYFQERNLAEGKPIKALLKLFTGQIQKAGLLVAHNMQYDYNVLGAEFLRAKLSTGKVIKKACTKELGTPVCKLPGKYGRYKWPELTELHLELFGEKFDGAHDALDDVKATARCFFEMKKRGDIKCP